MASDKTTCIGIRTQKLDPQNKVEHYWMLFIKLLSKYFLSLGNQVQIVEKHQYFMTICLQAWSSCFVVEFDTFSMPVKPLPYILLVLGAPFFDEVLWALSQAVFSPLLPIFPVQDVHIHPYPTCVCGLQDFSERISINWPDSLKYCWWFDSLAWHWKVLVL